MLENLIPLFKKEGIINPLTQIARFYKDNLDPANYQFRFIANQNHQLYLQKEKRVLDAIFMKKEPDRVPVIGNGINFFPAYYAGVSCTDFMYDRKKLEYATIKLIQDFDLDMFFIHYLFGIGKLVSLSDFQLVKIPGRDLADNIAYQYNEQDRLQPNEYQAFLQEGMEFLKNTYSPRAAGVFAKTGLQKTTTETMLIFETIKFGLFVYRLMNIMKAYGGYCIFGTAGFPQIGRASCRERV